MTDEQRAADLLQKIATIARGVEVGITGRLRDVRRGDMMTIARDICDAYGVSYKQTDLKPLRIDHPVTTTGPKPPSPDLFHVKQSPATAPATVAAEHESSI